ncbi:MAG: carbohydrate binding domain-containing protein, partial [Clostridia bacterium]|nr:carbohydrate binding domain-containing protein [Clostridia bacterium]
MKKLRLLLTVFCILALCVATFTVSTASAEANGPTIGNTTFASDSEIGSVFSWADGSSDAHQRGIDTTTDHTGDGSYSLKMTNFAAHHHMVRFAITGLTAGKDYKFSVWMKIEDFFPAPGDGGSGAYINVGASQDTYSNKMGWGNDLEENSSRDWTYYECFLSPEEDTNYVVVRLWSAIGSLWVDDMKIEEVKPNTDPIIPDASFAAQDLDAGWWSWKDGTASKTIDTTMDKTGDGSYSLKVTNETQCHHVLRIEATNLVVGMDYTFSAWMKPENVYMKSDAGAGAYINIGASADNYSNQIGWGNDVEQPLTRDWDLREATFTASATTYYINIRLWSASGTLWVDDLKLTPHAVIELETDDAGLVDGKFASQSVKGRWKDGWKNGGLYEWSTESHTKDGTGSLKVTT